MTLQLKKTYLVAMSIGFLIFVPVLFIFSLNHGVNFGLGILIGIFPFISWDLLANLLRPDKKITARKKLLLGLLAFSKISFLGAILFLITRTQFFLPWPFIIGMSLVMPVVVISILVFFSKLK
ncbi:MAG: hypothetical protein KAS70_01465 [Planctomycetes bacterium]|nr:hypothetical protein [Planctomycetota bacterium]